MVVLFCSFKTNKKFAQKNRTGPCSLLCSFYVRKLEQLFAQSEQNSHSIQNPNKFAQFAQLEQNSHTLFNFEQIHINSHKITRDKRTHLHIS